MNLVKGVQKTEVHISKGNVLMFLAIASTLDSLRHQKYLFIIIYSFLSMKALHYIGFEFKKTKYYTTIYLL